MESDFAKGSTGGRQNHDRNLFQYKRYICRDPPCKRTFSVLPEEVLPYCRFFLGDLLNLAQTLAEGWSAYWIAKHQWELSLRVILRGGLLIQKAELWLEDVCRKTALSFGADLQSLVELALKTFSWFGFTQRWFQHLYPCRIGRALTQHNLGIKRL
jgi:hypothetical protein